MCTIEGNTAPITGISTSCTAATDCSQLAKRLQGLTTRHVVTTVAVDLHPDNLRRTNERPVYQAACKYEYRP